MSHARNVNITIFAVILACKKYNPLTVNLIRNLKKCSSLVKELEKNTLTYFIRNLLALKRNLSLICSAKARKYNYVMGKIDPYLNTEIYGDSAMERQEDFLLLFTTCLIASLVNFKLNHTQTIKLANDISRIDERGGCF